MTLLHGHDLRRAFEAGTKCLERYRDAINALNVFPVPDGDTGTNMLLTMRAALEKDPDSPSAGDVLAALAEGSFWGARGNSGVILSQMFRGFAEALQGRETCDAPALSRALNLASSAAYASVSQPVEGTMLSVIRGASDGVQAMGDSPKDATDNLNESSDIDAGPIPAWERAFHAAAEALRLTPNQLPILKEAGVIDAGGMGVVVILGGALCALTGQEQTLVDEAVARHCVQPAPAQKAGSLVDGDALETNWGYCIQYVIQGSGLDVEEIRRGLGDGAEQSAVVAGGGNQVRVHVHALDPGPALSLGASFGELVQISIENMDHQTAGFVADHQTNSQPGAQTGDRINNGISVMAVARGEGITRLFLEAGCSRVIPGGQTMNPSVGQILEAAAAFGSGEVIVLPNNPNILAAVRQASKANPRLRVVASLTVPQGVAALLAFNPEESLEHNIDRMTAALDGVVTIEVTRAVRTSQFGGLDIKPGQFIGLLEGELATTGGTPESALMAAFKKLDLSPDQVLTIYQGADALPGALEHLLLELAALVPGIQVDVLYGGQANHHYLASVE